MLNDQFTDPKHQKLRGTLRVVGPLIAGIGLLFTLVGFVDFFKAFSSFAPPRYFWCLFVGLPLLGIGGSITAFAYMGSIAGFQAREVAPVAKDTFNYLARETGEAVKTITRHISEGDATQNEITCAKCLEINAGNALYCKKCGSRLAGKRSCSSCGKENDPDARYCQGCGKQLP